MKRLQTSSRYRPRCGPKSEADAPNDGDAAHVGTRGRAGRERCVERFVRSDADSLLNCSHNVSIDSGHGRCSPAMSHTYHRVAATHCARAKVTGRGEPRQAIPRAAKPLEHRHFLGAHYDPPCTRPVLLQGMRTSQRVWQTS